MIAESTILQYNLKSVNRSGLASYGHDLMFVDEIDCHDLFEGDNPRERIMIFEFEY